MTTGNNDNLTPHTDPGVIRRHLTKAFDSYASILGLDETLCREVEEFINEAHVPVEEDFGALKRELARVKSDVRDLMNAATKPAPEPAPVPETPAQNEKLPPLAPGPDPEDAAEDADPDGRRGLSGREMERVREMAVKGVNAAEISRIVGRPHTTVRRFVRRLENAGVVPMSVRRVSSERFWEQKRNSEKSARAAKQSEAVN